MAMANNHVSLIHTQSILVQKQNDGNTRVVRRMDL